MKSNLDSMFKADDKSEQGGIWFNFGEKTGFRVRRFSIVNPLIKKAMAKYHAPYARQITLGTLDQKKEIEINVRVFVDCCLVDWRGVEIDDTEVPFSKAKAVEVLLNLPELFDTLSKLSQDFNNYKEDVDTEAVGNS